MLLNVTMTDLDCCAISVFKQENIDPYAALNLTKVFFFDKCWPTIVCSHETSKQVMIAPCFFKSNEKMTKNAKLLDRLKPYWRPTASLKSLLNLLS